MAVGDWHTFPNGYTYQETLHGPLTGERVSTAGSGPQKHYAIEAR